MFSIFPSTSCSIINISTNLSVHGCLVLLNKWFILCLLQAADSQIVSDYVRHFLHQHTWVLLIIGDSMLQLWICWFIITWSHWAIFFYYLNGCDGFGKIGSVSNCISFYCFSVGFKTVQKVENSLLYFGAILLLKQFEPYINNYSVGLRSMMTWFFLHLIQWLATMLTSLMRKMPSV